MATLRAVLRLLGFVLFTGIMFVVVIVTRIATLASASWWRRARHAQFRFWAHGIALLLGMRVEVIGEAPRAPFLLVANHLSYMDIPLLAHFVDARFVAKMEVARWPFLGAVVRSVNTIFIDRANRRDLLRVSREVNSALHDGEGVVIFGEGTSSNGDEVLPLKPSLLEVALDGQRAVHYARVHYLTPRNSAPAGDVICWWDDTPLVKHLMRLFALPGFHALVHFGPDAVEGRDRKELAQVLRAKISALPTTREQPLHAH